MYGMGRLFEMLCREGGLRTRVHQTLEEAAAWLWPTSFASTLEAGVSAPVAIAVARAPRLRGRLGVVQPVTRGGGVSVARAMCAS